MNQSFLFPNHPDLPPLPEGQFWRIGTKYSGLGFDYIKVDLRQKFWWFSYSIENMHSFPDQKGFTDREIAIWLAKKINYKVAQNNINVNLGDLKGDHP